MPDVWNSERPTSILFSHTRVPPFANICRNGRCNIAFWCRCSLILSLWFGVSILFCCTIKIHIFKAQKHSRTISYVECIHVLAETFCNPCPVNPFLPNHRRQPGYWYLLRARVGWVPGIQRSCFCISCTVSTDELFLLPGLFSTIGDSLDSGKFKQGCFPVVSCFAMLRCFSMVFDEPTVLENASLCWSLCNWIWKDVLTLCGDHAASVR